MSLYHVSCTRGLKTLQPRVSTHGKAWVYAVRDLTTGLLFGTRHDDFDFMIDLFDNPTLAYQIGDVSRQFD